MNASGVSGVAAYPFSMMSASETTPYRYPLPE